MHPPLQGIRIVEFEGLGPGPLAGRMLADMGAEVTVIARRQRTAVADRLGGSKHSPLRRGKTIVPLDLKQPPDLAEALRLVATADGIANHLQRGEEPGSYDPSDNLGLYYLWERWPQERRARFLDEIPGLMEEALRAAAEERGGD